MPQNPRNKKLSFSFLDVVAHANDVVIVTDAKTGKIVYVNRAFSALTLYTPEQALGNSPGLLLQGPDTDQRTVTRIRQAIKDGVGIRTDILNYDKSGRPYWLDMNIVPLCDANGTLQHFAAIERDVTAHRQLNAQLQKLAATDELTGLANRRSFNYALRREMLHKHRTGEPLSLVAFDLDYFKKINDACGHSAGDAVLRAVTQRCAPLLRPRDLLARTGGEEFHVLLPNTNLSEAALVAERLRVAIETALVFDMEHLIAATASFGVTSVLSHEIEVDPALSRADALLYTAKNSGRNRVCADIEAEASEPSDLAIVDLNAALTSSMHPEPPAALGHSASKNLSVNNVHVQLDLAERNDRGSDVVERHEAAFKHLVSHE